jgi:hypothetical protein
MQTVLYLDLEQSTHSALSRLAENVILDTDRTRCLIDRPEAIVFGHDGDDLGAVARCNVLFAKDRVEVETLRGR